MKRFTIPRDIYYGQDALKALKRISGSRACIVLGGGSMQKFGFLEKATLYLKEAGIEYCYIENVEPDPSVETVKAGSDTMRKFEPDVIIALGGGSVIDAAKAMWAFYEDPNIDFENLHTHSNFPKLRNKAILVAIPSTSGTASEVTAFSVITDYETGVKYPISDYQLTPDIAILDPDLAQTMPPHLTAYTGMDALTHAIESYVSTGHNQFSDPLALKTIEMVFEYLPDSFAGNNDAREQMHYAQCIAGMAFSNAYLGIVHSIAHKTGAAFSTGHIPHGCANAMYLPYVIEYNSADNDTCKRYAEIARRLNIKETDDKAMAKALSEKIKLFNLKLNIPSSLKEFGIKEEEFLNKIENISALSLQDGCTYTNPRKIDKKAMNNLLKQIYYGNEDIIN